MALDVSWLSGGMPIFAFALVFFIVYAILAKVKVLGTSKVMNFIVSLIFAIIFITFSSVRNYIINITPWFIVLLIVTFMFLLLLGFATKDWQKFTKPLAIVFMILLIVVALVAIFYTFPSTQAILPGKVASSNSNNIFYRMKQYLNKEKIKSGFWLLIVAILAILIIAVPK